MSAIEGACLVWYQGARARRAARSAGWWPCWAYQTIARLKQTSPKGTVRPTARGVRLRAWPTPASWRLRQASRDQHAGDGVGPGLGPEPDRQGAEDLEGGGGEAAAEALQQAADRAG